jgi:hypothetical protein
MDGMRIEKPQEMQCSTGTRPPGCGMQGTRSPRPRDGGTPGGTFPHIPFLGGRGGTRGDATPQKGDS